MQTISKIKQFKLTGVRKNVIALFQCNNEAMTRAMILQLRSV